MLAPGSELHKRLQAEVDVTIARRRLPPVSHDNVMGAADTAADVIMQHCTNVLWWDDPERVQHEIHCYRNTGSWQGGTSHYLFSFSHAGGGEIHRYLEVASYIRDHFRQVEAGSPQWARVGIWDKEGERLTHERAV